MNYCFGVDIGGTTVKFGLFTTDGDLLDKWQIRTRKENSGCEILPDIARSLEEKIKEKNIGRSGIAGIGVGVPAPVSEEGVVENTANLGWDYKEVSRELRERTGFPVKTGNDANVAALGEMWLGAGKGQRNLIMVTLGTGVGGGIVVDGRLLTGSGGAAAEIGHICVNRTETEPCGCGKYGCLEQYASATGIRMLAEKRLAEDQTPSLLREGETDAKAVFDALKEGDALAKEVVEAFAAYLGHALADLAVITDPSLIIIGGGVSKAGEILIEYVEKYFRESAFFANQNVKLAIASLDNDAGICGAAKLLLDSVQNPAE